MRRIFLMLSIGVLLLLVFLVYGQVEPIEEWVARYGSPGNNSDTPYAIAIDSFGNVYVTGGSYGIGTSSDYATVKYDSNGNQLWIALYDGPANDYDMAKAIAVDSFGNVYVTGGSYGIGTDSDCATVKYDTDGNKIWDVRYSSSGYQYDSASAIAVDSSGNVYVTGRASSAYITLKYDTNGNELWVALSTGGFAKTIAVDSFGNVFVSGEKGDYVTVKYDTNGNELWEARYDGAGGYELLEAIAVDSFGNIYVTGWSMGSEAERDWAIVKYDTNGNELWVRRPCEGWAYDIGVDSSGNVYVTGYCNDSVRDAYEFGTIKYDPYGNQLWFARYHGPESYEDWAEAITVDSFGNVYVTGGGWGIGTDLDFVTIAYDTSGNELWVARYDGPINGEDYAKAIAVDSSGNVYVTGDSKGNGTGYDYATLKYSNTQPGSDVEVEPTDPDTGEAPVGLTFDEVTEGGETTLNVTETGAPPDIGFKLGNPPHYYEIETTAVYSGPIEICIDYTEINFAGPEENLKLFHQEIGGYWIDITTFVDTENNIIWGIANSLSTFAIFEAMLEVDIDIKPSGYPNSINLGSNGNVPVAIFSTPDFDATTINPTEVTLAGAEVRLKGKGDAMAKFEDVDGDGLLDIVVHIDTRALELSLGDTEAILEGKTHDGILFWGVDTVRIVQE